MTTNITYWPLLFWKKTYKNSKSGKASDKIYKKSKKMSNYH